MAEQLQRWTFVLSIIGYPVAGLISTAFDIGNSNISIALRVAVAALSLGGVLSALRFKVRIRIDAWLVLFLALYLFRLLADLSRADLPTTGDDLLAYVVITLPPVICVMSLGGQWNDRTAARAMFILGAAACLGALVLELTGLAGSQSHTAETSRLRFDKVNPITFGHLGVSTLLAALASWSGSRDWRRLTFILLGCVPAIAVLILANSRSPYVSLAVAIGAFLLMRGRWALFASLVVGGVVLVLGGNILALLSGSRLTDFADESAIERLVMQRYAGQQFIDHPLLGSAHLELYSQMYPHNLFYESAMSMGVVGLALFTIISATAIWRSIWAMRSGGVLAALMFWQAFVLGQLSSNIFGNAALFSVMALLIYIGRRPPRRVGSPARPSRWSAVLKRGSDPGRRPPAAFGPPP